MPDTGRGEGRERGRVGEGELGGEGGGGRVRGEEGFDAAPCVSVFHVLPNGGSPHNVLIFYGGS